MSNQTCGCGCAQCTCGSKASHQTCSSCQSCHNCQGSYQQQSCSQKGDFTHQLLELADCAWMEVLKEKIKQHIQNNSEQNLDELARIISEGNKERWKSKMSTKDSVCEVHEKVMNFFHQSACSCKSNDQNK